MSKQPDTITVPDNSKGSVRIDKCVHERARKYADDHGHKITFVYEKAITDFLTRNGTTKKGGER